MKGKRMSSLKEKAKEVIEFLKFKEDNYNKDGTIINFKPKSKILHKIEAYIQTLHYN